VAAGRGVGYTLPTLAAEYLPSEVRAVPVVDVEPGSVLLAWPRDRVDGLTDVFLRIARAAIADGAPGVPAGRAGHDGR
jgi:hypothetical protein